MKMYCPVVAFSGPPANQARSRSMSDGKNAIQLTTTS